MLQASQLEYRYQQAGQVQPVLKGVDLQLQVGEKVALVGSSGSGKSTLLNLLGGLERPAAGTIQLDGQQFSALMEPELTLFRRAHIGFVYQQFNLIPTLTVAENIRLPLELLGVSQTLQQRKLEDWLAAVDLSGRKEDFPDRLSGGEQQRVAIARALIHEPKLVLADEPTGNLDLQTGERILALLFDLAQARSQTLLVVTHSQAVAGRAGRQLCLRDGVLLAGGGNRAW
ncbi:MAG TPA: ABC transporter ATP-binding protein [Thiolinea sp.]|nr:ABC transporter ATP-binding protein [Thiolinea sp.]